MNCDCGHHFDEHDAVKIVPEPTSRFADRYDLPCTKCKCLNFRLIKTQETSP